MINRYHNTKKSTCENIFAMYPPKKPYQPQCTCNYVIFISVFWSLKRRTISVYSYAVSLSLAMKAAQVLCFLSILELLVVLILLILAAALGDVFTISLILVSLRQSNKNIRRVEKINNEEP